MKYLPNKANNIDVQLNFDMVSTRLLYFLNKSLKKIMYRDSYGMTTIQS